MGWAGKVRPVLCQSILRVLRRVPGPPTGPRESPTVVHVPTDRMRPHPQNAGSGNPSTLFRSPPAENSFFAGVLFSGAGAWPPPPLKGNPRMSTNEQLADRHWRSRNALTPPTTTSGTTTAPGGSTTPSHTVRPRSRCANRWPRGASTRPAGNATPCSRHSFWPDVARHETAVPQAPTQNISP